MSSPPNSRPLDLTKFRPYERACPCCDTICYDCYDELEIPPKLQYEYHVACCGARSYTDSSGLNCLIDYILTADRQSQGVSFVKFKDLHKEEYADVEMNNYLEDLHSKGYVYHTYRRDLLKWSWHLNKYEGDGRFAPGPPTCPICGCYVRNDDIGQLIDQEMYHRIICRPTSNSGHLVVDAVCNYIKQQTQESETDDGVPLSHVYNDVFSDMFKKKKKHKGRIIQKHDIVLAVDTLEMTGILVTYFVNGVTYGFFHKSNRPM